MGENILAIIIIILVTIAIVVGYIFIGFRLESHLVGIEERSKFVNRRALFLRELSESLRRKSESLKKRQEDCISAIEVLENLPYNDLENYGLLIEKFKKINHSKEKVDNKKTIVDQEKTRVKQGVIQVAKERVKLENLLKLYKLWRNK